MSTLMVTAIIASIGDVRREDDKRANIFLFLLPLIFSPREILGSIVACASFYFCCSLFCALIVSLQPSLQKIGDVLKAIQTFSTPSHIPKKTTKKPKSGKQAILTCFVNLLSFEWFPYLFRAEISI